MKIHGLNLLILNSILNAFDEEDIYIFKLPTFIPKSDKEIELCNFLKNNNPQFSFVMYLLIQKMKYALVLNNLFEDEELFDEMIFYDLSFAHVFQESIIFYNIPNEIKKIIPQVFKFTERYSLFLTKMNNIFSYKIESVDDFEKIIKASFSFNVRKELNKLKKLFLDTMNELNSFSDITIPVKKQILNKVNIKTKGDVIFDDNDINFFSIYPEFVFFSKFLNRENVSTLYIAKKINSNIYSSLNKFYMIKYIYDYDEAFKNKLLDQVIFEKFLLQIKFSNLDLNLKPNDFRFNFIKEFNKKRLNNTLIDNYMEKYLSFENKNYENIEELENKFSSFVFKMGEELAENPSVKIIKPCPDAKNEIILLANKISNILRKD